MEHNEKSKRNQTPIEEVLAELAGRANKARSIDFDLLMDWCKSDRVPDDEIRSINRAIGAANNSYYRASCYYDGINPDEQKDEKANERAAAAALLMDIRGLLNQAARYQKAATPDNPLMAGMAQSKRNEAAALTEQLFRHCAENDILPTDGKRGKDSAGDAEILAQFDAWRANQ